MGKSKGPGLRKASTSATITLPLKYVMALEACGDALAGLMDEGLSAERVEDAAEALKREGEAENLLDGNQKEALGLFD